MTDEKAPSPAPAPSTALEKLKPLLATAEEKGRFYAAQAAPLFKKLADEAKLAQLALKDKRKRAMFKARWQQRFDQALAASGFAMAKTGKKKKGGKGKGGKDKPLDMVAVDTLAKYFFDQEMLKHPLRTGASTLVPLKVQKGRTEFGPDERQQTFTMEMHGVNTFDKRVVISAVEVADDRYRSGVLSVRGDTLLGLNFGDGHEKLMPALDAFHRAYEEHARRNAKKAPEEEKDHSMKLRGA